MSGFNNDPLQYINLITDNLSDRYLSGFPVLKELIQNTDDAKASCLDFGISKGIPESKHPLLQGTALFLINNGEFKASDARGIRSFGLNSKAADKSTIGKFGLGMKSIFHFCEAFFFLANDGEKEYTEILNPWSANVEAGDEVFHNNWNTFNLEDAQLIKRHLKPVLASYDANQGNSPFVLWIPLRSERHLIKDNGEEGFPIIKEFPADDISHLDFLKAKDLPNNLATLFPFLRHLEQLTYWGKTSGFDFKNQYSISLQKSALRIQLIDQVVEDESFISTEPLVLKGVIEVNNGDDIDITKHEFIGQEKIVWNENLKQLRQSKVWPESKVRSNKGQALTVSDKAIPHGSVVFSRSPGNGQLISNWSVFLPLEDKYKEVIHPNSYFGKHNYHLFLHGYFFIDAGRQGIHGFDECDNEGNEKSDTTEILKRKWNCELSQSLVLRQVLPELSHFCEDLSLSDESRTQLSGLLVKTQLWKNYAEAITQETIWVREINQQGLSWKLHDANQKTLPLNEPPRDDLNRPWLVFPALKNIQENIVFILYGSANLSLNSAQWSQDHLLSLLESVDVVSTFKSQKLLSYLAGFVCDVSPPELGALATQAAIRKLLREALNTLGVNLLKENKKLINKIISVLHTDKYISISKSYSNELIKEVSSVLSEVLLIPDLFDVNGAKGKLDLNDASALLKKISDLSKTNYLNNEKLEQDTFKLAAEIFSKVQQDYISKLLERTKELRIWEAYDCQKQSKVSVSFLEITKAKENGVLFGYSQGTIDQRLGLSIALQKVLPKEKLLIISNKTAQPLEFTVHACNPSQVLQCVGHTCRELGDINTRLTLIKSIASSPDPKIKEHKVGLRYLLHADIRNFSNTDSSLWILGHQQHPVWEKLWAFTVDDGDPWNLIDKKLADTLPPNIWDVLNIKEIRANSVLEEITKESRDISLQNFLPTEDESSEILVTIINNNDKNLWLQMPIHQTTDGQFISANKNNVYFETEGLELDESLLENISIIKRSSNQIISQGQERWLQSIDDSVKIKIALGAEKPEKHWQLIMDSLEELQNSPEKEKLEELSNTLKTTQWLLTKTGSAFSPEDTIALDSAQSEVEQIISKESDVYTCDSLLAKTLKEHAAFGFLRENYLAYGEAGIRQLALLVGDLPYFHIGKVEVLSIEDYEKAVNVLKDTDFSGWKLLGHLFEKYSTESYEHVFKAINKSVNIDEIILIMGWISKLNKASDEIQLVFNTYLSLFVEYPEPIDQLDRIKLLNQASKWKRTKELTADASGLSKSYLLNKKQEAILLSGGLINEVNEQPTVADTGLDNKIYRDPKATVSLFKDYFLGWLDQGVSESFIATLSLLLGRDEKVKELVDDYTSQTVSREWLIENIPWKRPDQSIAYSSNKLPWLNESSFTDALNKVSLVLHTIKEKEVSVRSLLNKTITVPLEDSFKHIFVGRTERVPLSDHHQIFLGLRRIEISDYPEPKLIKLIKSSIEYLLEVAYKQRSPNLENLWMELEDSDQITIDVARALILQDIRGSLKRLRLPRHKELQKHLDKYHHENKNSIIFKDKEKGKSFNKSRDEALIALQDFIIGNSEVKEIILNALRDKVKEFQYSPTSIPFEMFQNADDAFIDLQKIKAHPLDPKEKNAEILPESIRKFVIHIEDDWVMFMHWGRPINWTGSNGFPGKDFQFDNDLENMLILSASDKAGEVTGKFGLGFKSVLLAVDEPHIVSGRIQTKIEAGLLPLPFNDVGFIRAKLREAQSDSQYPGTAISLPLTLCDSKELLGRFKEVMGILPVFSKQIQTISIQGDDEQIAYWRGDKLAESIETGSVTLDRNNGFQAIKFSCEHGDLLFALDTQGFNNLPSGLPNFWVTAPVQESEKIGFAINAMFSIDAGRLRLAADIEPNITLMEKLGSEWARQLEKLVQMIDHDWNSCLDRLKLSPTIIPYDFWVSFFRSIMERLSRLSKSSAVYKLTITVLKNALPLLIQNKPIIPNGLFEDQYLLVYPDIKYVLKDAILDLELYKTIRATQLFKDCIEPDKSISNDIFEWIADLVPELRKTKDQWQSITLTSIISKIQTIKISPNDSSTLNELAVFEKRENYKNNNKDTRKDFEKAKEKLLSSEFLNDNNDWVKADSLVSNSSDDEKLRWDFAPDSCRLSSTYSKDGISFFKYCRVSMKAPAEELCNWITDAKDDDRRKASMKYLVSGKLGNDVADKLLENGLAASWLSSLEEESIYLSELSKEDRDKLLYKILKSTDDLKKQAKEPSLLQHTKIRLNPVIALNAIYDWWIKERHKYITDYQNNIYPDFLELNFSMDDYGELDRSSWLALLLLGGFHTLGRAKPQQHRNFLTICERKGWWNTFTDQHIDKNFKEWMSVLDAFFDAQIDAQEYEQWMMRFPVIYKLSRHLDDYSGLFIGLKKYNRQFDLLKVLSSKADSAQQGGGISAPALGNTLGMGANFILRELLRSKALPSNDYMHEHAFVPYKAVRELLESMGLEGLDTKNRLEQSRHIYWFLSKHLDITKITFDNDFDIPLKIVAEEYEKTGKTCW